MVVKAFVEMIEEGEAKVSRMGHLSDLDSWEDLLNYSERFYKIPKSIITYLNQRLGKALPFIQREISGTSYRFFTLHHNKGSPLFILTAY